MPINEPVVDPNIRIPRAPSLEVPRVAQLRAFTPQVITPHLTDIRATSDIARTMREASETGNEVAKEYAKQAGYTAVMRDADGNLVVNQAPIVGDAAIAFHEAVKYTALSQGESEAKQKDLVLSKQFLDNPQGYLDAANAFRKEHVQQYTQAFGGDVGAALGRSIDTATTNNFRFLVLQQQGQIKRNFDQSTRARIDSLDQDIFSGLESDPKFLDTSQGKTLLQQRIGATQLRVNSPLTAEAPEVAALDLKQFDLKVGAAKFTSGIKTILNNPDGGIGAAQQAIDSTLNDPKLTPLQRQINAAEGSKAIKDYQLNLERQLNLSNKAQKIRDENFEDTVIKDSASGNPTITENQIKTQPGISPESRMRMLAWQKRDGMPEPMARVSQANATDLFRRMFILEEGDPGKLTSMSAARAAYGNGQLTRQDEDWLEKRFIEARSPEGSKLTSVRAEFSKAVEPSIDKSNPMMGKIDQDGKLQSYAFQRYIDDRIDEYRKAGKSPETIIHELFTPGQPNYLGKDEVVDKFRIPLSQSINNLSRNLGLGPAAPGARTAPARQPGESPADYLKRMQQGGQQ
jgi:hypothetical protein